MKTKSDGIEVVSEQAGPSVQEDLASRLIALDRHLAEVLAAQREISDRLELIERKTAGVTSGGSVAPETGALWEDTVRRFTGSIDVRLDILEDELGGLQDELNGLRQVASESADGVQRRLTRRYALGQAILGALIFVLLLIVWPAGDGVRRIGAPSAGASHTRVAPLSKPSADSPGASSLTDRSSADKTGAGVEMDRPAASRSDSGGDQATLSVALPENSVPLQKEGAIDPIVESRTAQGVQAQRPEVSAGRDDAGPPNAAIAPGTSSAGGQVAAESGGVQPAPQVAGATEKDTGSKETLAAAEGDTGSDAATGEGTIVLTEERFAVQLVGYNSESWVWRFVEKFGIGGTAHYLHIRDQDRDMYVVLLGDYSTREQGRAAIAALPPELRDLEPLVRALPAGTRLVPVGAARGTE